MPDNLESKDYLLGTKDEELVRLGFQHRVWARYAFAAWERAGFGPGQRILDLGCGPGFATMDLSALVGTHGRVVAVDGSKRYADHLNATVKHAAIANVEVQIADVQELKLPSESIDGAFTRWLLCYLQRPEAVIAHVARALRPGAAFVVQDYFNYRALCLAPEGSATRRAGAAVFDSLAESGGDCDVGGRVPDTMIRAGLRIQEVRPIQRIARPGSALWHWPVSFFKLFLPKLVEQGLFTAQEHAAFNDEWAKAASNPAAFFFTPPVLEIIGVKPQA